MKFCNSISFYTKLWKGKIQKWRSWYEKKYSKWYRKLLGNSPWLTWFFVKNFLAVKKFLTLKFCLFLRQADMWKDEKHDTAMNVHSRTKTFWRHEIALTTIMMNKEIKLFKDVWYVFLPAWFVEQFVWVFVQQFCPEPVHVLLHFLHLLVKPLPHITKLIVHGWYSQVGSISNLIWTWIYWIYTSRSISPEITKR